MILEDDYITITEPKIDKKLKRAQSLVGRSLPKLDHEFYPSSPASVQALLNVEKFEGSILEPACGDGAICKVLEANGYSDIAAVDLIDRGYGQGGHDFLTSSLTSDNIITNPPFTLAEDFVTLGLQRTTKKVALLVKLAFLEGAKRKIMFENSPLARVWVFSKRVSMTRNGVKMKNSGMIAFCWVVFEHGYTGKPTIGWI